MRQRARRDATGAASAGVARRRLTPACAAGPSGTGSSPPAADAGSRPGTPPSVIGMSILCRSARSRTDRQLTTPSATCPPPAASAGSSPMPAASRMPNLRLRDSGEEQVATRSPSPASPAKVAGPPQRLAQPGDLVQPAGDQRCGRVQPKAEALRHPAGQRDDVLAGTRDLGPDDVGDGVRPEVGVGAGQLHRDRPLVVGARQHRRGRPPGGDLQRQVGSGEHRPPARVDLARPARSPRSSAGRYRSRRPWRATRSARGGQ